MTGRSTRPRRPNRRSMQSSTPCRALVPPAKRMLAGPSRRGQIRRVDYPQWPPPPPVPEPVEEPTRQLALSVHPHRFAPQTSPPPCALQLLPQLPQLASSLLTTRSHPSSGPWFGRSQLPKPGTHVETHTPARHSSDET